MFAVYMSTECAGEMGGTVLHVFTHLGVCTGVHVYTCVYDNTLDP